MMKTKAELMNGNVGTKTCDTEDGKTQLTGFSRLWVLVILSVIIDWTAIIMATVSLQVSGIKNQTIINVIGSTIGFSHFDLVAFILDSVKRVKITRSNHIKSIETPKKSQTE
jgi:hypothetical protein